MVSNFMDLQPGSYFDLKSCPRWDIILQCRGEFMAAMGVRSVEHLVEVACCSHGPRLGSQRILSESLNWVTPASFLPERPSQLRRQRQCWRRWAVSKFSRSSCLGSRAVWRANLESFREGAQVRFPGTGLESEAQSLDTRKDLSLLSFIETGPLAAAIPLTTSPSRLFARWRAWGQFLFKELTLDAAQETNQVRVYHLYLPIFAWCLDIVHRLQRDARRKHHGVIIGMQCPQGGGKTTLTTALQRLFALENRQCVSLSIDDFYLTRREQEALAKAFPENPLLESRGNPGTHDITLALQTLDRLVTAPGTEDQSSLAVPRYDKSAFQGRGDRAPPEQWHCYQRPVDVVFLEGWCLGFRPLEFHHRPAEMDPALLRNLIQVDRFLAQDFCRLYPLLDAFIVIALDGSSLKEALQTVYQWRLQAEQQMRAAGRPAMTDEQVYAFVDKFMPAYQAYLSDLYESPPLTGDASRELRVGIDGTRAPTRLFLRS